MIKPWIIPDMDKVMLNKVTSHEMSSSVSNFRSQPPSALRLSHMRMTSKMLERQNKEGASTT